MLTRKGFGPELFPAGLRCRREGRGAVVVVEGRELSVLGGGRSTRTEGGPGEKALWQTGAWGTCGVRVNTEGSGAAARGQRREGVSTGPTPARFRTRCQGQAEKARGRRVRAAQESGWASTAVILPGGGRGEFHPGVGSGRGPQGRPITTPEGGAGFCSNTIGKKTPKHSPKMS